MALEENADTRAHDEEAVGLEADFPSSEDALIEDLLKYADSAEQFRIIFEDWLLFFLPDSPDVHHVFQVHFCENTEYQMNLGRLRGAILREEYEEAKVWIGNIYRQVVEETNFELLVHLDKHLKTSLDHLDARLAEFRNEIFTRFAQSISRAEFNQLLSDMGQSESRRERRTDAAIEEMEGLVPYLEESIGAMERRLKETLLRAHSSLSDQSEAIAGLTMLSRNLAERIVSIGEREGSFSDYMEHSSDEASNKFNAFLEEKLEEAVEQFRLALEIEQKSAQRKSGFSWKNLAIAGGLIIGGATFVQQHFRLNEIETRITETSDNSKKSNQDSPAVDYSASLTKWSVSEHGFEDTVKQVEAMEAAGLVVNCGSFDLENGQPSEFARVNSPSRREWMNRTDVREACEGSSEVKFRVEY